MEALRVQGVLCVNYLDDFFIFGKSYNECQMNTAMTVELLNSLGFLINVKKCNLEPSQKQRFLGFIFNSNNMSIELPMEKKLKIKKYTQYFLNIKSCKIRLLAEFIGVLIAACPAIKYGWLYTKNLERLKFIALKENSGDYEAIMELPEGILPELNWWNANIMSSKNNLKQDFFNLEIYTDASLSGWGACTSTESTHGWWSEKDK